MPKIRYKEKVFNDRHLAIIEKADEILNEYTAQGYDITLRQLYYQFVARGIIPNNDREYKNLGTIINDARLAGLIDWDHIVDRTRKVRGVAHWDDPADIVEACAKQFRIDKWVGQKYRVEVWIEKDALVGVIERPCTREDVQYFSCRGYTSQTEIWSAATKRLIPYEKAGQMPFILHFGDHDPSGIDMTRDIQERLSMFGSQAVVQRMALNMPQVQQYNPPPNPAKITDSRAQGYIKKFGDESWELDALDPKVIDALITKAVAKLRDAKKWKAKVEEENAHRAQLQAISDKWGGVTAQLDDIPDDEPAEEPEEDEDDDGDA